MKTTISLYSIFVVVLLFLYASCKKENTITCETLMCLNGSTCEEAIDGPTCICLPGSSGTNCEILESCFGLCQNGGVCENEACHCPEGFYGTYCEIETIQRQLDNGKTPMQIFNEGHPLDSIYGKIYQGGLIFFLDVLDEIQSRDGLLVAQEDTGDFEHWDITLCDVTINGTHDWRLPSRVELNLMWENLHRLGCSSEPIPLPSDAFLCESAVGNFYPVPFSSCYYSSEEDPQEEGWIYRQNFEKGNQVLGYWPIAARTRCIRSF